MRAAFHLGGVGVKCQPGHSPSVLSRGLRALLVWEQRSFVITHRGGQLLFTESTEAGQAPRTNAQVVRIEIEMACNIYIEMWANT